MQPYEYCLLSDERLLELCSGRDRSGRTLLHLAAQWTQLDLVSRLLVVAPRSSLTQRDVRGRTPLIAAAVRRKGSRNHVQILEMLWEAYNSDERAMRDKRGRNVMHWLAARLRGTGAVRSVTAVLGEVPEELLMRKDSDGNTVLHCVARTGHCSIGDYGLEQVVVGKAVSSTALFASYLLKCAPQAEKELNKEGRTPLMACIVRKDFIATGVLLSAATVEGLCTVDQLRRSILYYLLKHPSFMRACLENIGDDFLLALPWELVLHETKVVNVRALLGSLPHIMRTAIANAEDICDERPFRRLLTVILKWGSLDKAASLLRRAHPTIRARLYAEVLALLTRPYAQDLPEPIESVVAIVTDAPDEVFSDGTLAVRACKNLPPMVLRIILRRSPPEGPFRRKGSDLISQFCSPQNYVVLAEELDEEVLVSVPLVHLLIFHPDLEVDVWQEAIDTLPHEALLFKDILTGETAAHCVARVGRGDKGAMLMRALLQAAPELRHEADNDGRTPVEYARRLGMDASIPSFQVLQGMTKGALPTS